ncbi:sortase [Granulosicoccaceae sp. 1_MG-2023]|nr:sortase [Granulosicoccaceae sp. 1_MG-2023]
MKRRHIVFLLALSGAALLAQAGWYSAKATLAQWILPGAYRAMLNDGAPVRPWPWADTRVSGRLQFGTQTTLYVMEGGSGEAMAFGPARLNPKMQDVVVIGGHRDTHMGFLGDVHIGDEIRLTLADGKTRVYRFAQIEIADTQRDQLLVEADRPGLVLITCYPLQTLRAGGTQRLIAIALPVEATAQQS